jgi:hypothetical protein
VSTNGVTSSSTRYPPYADCNSCNFYLGDGGSVKVRREARKHVTETGHMVWVTVEDVTRYELAGEGRDGG